MYLYCFRGFSGFRDLEFRDFRKALDCMQSVTGIKLSKKVLTLSLKFLDSDFKLKYNRHIKLSNATQLQNLRGSENGISNCFNRNRSNGLSYLGYQECDLRNV